MDTPRQSSEEREKKKHCFWVWRRGQRSVGFRQKKGNSIKKRDKCCSERQKEMKRENWKGDFLGTTYQRPNKLVRQLCISYLLPF